MSDLLTFRAEARNPDTAVNSAPSPVIFIRVRRQDGTETSYPGRAAWMLDALIQRGAAGVSSLECQGPRVSHYVFVLRRSGLQIETVDESHGGAFSGSHARYILKTPLTAVALERGNKPKRQRRAA